MSDAQLGTISGRIELEDFFSSALGNVEKSLVHLDESFVHGQERIVEYATGYIEARAIIDGFREAVRLVGEQLDELFISGSKSSDIEGAFDHMTESAGHLSSTLLGEVKSATQGTISDLEIMKTTNQNLAAGMNLTDDQMKLVAKSAYALAKVTGGDVASAYQTMNQALEMGRVRAVQALTGRIDQQKAEEKFAESLGTTTSALNEEGKVEALRQAILEKLGTSLNRVGELNLTLADRVQQAKVAFVDFEDKLGVAIARSPVFEAAVNGITVALSKAFGGSQATAVATLTDYIEKAAVAAVGFAQKLVSGAAIVVDAWTVVKNFTLNIKQGFEAIADDIVSKLATVVKAASIIEPELKPAAAMLAKMDDDLYNSMAKQQAEIDANNASAAKFRQSLEPLQKTIDGIEQSMTKAKTTADAHAATLERVTAATKGTITNEIDLSKTTDSVGTSMQGAGKYIELTSQELLALQKTMMDTNRAAEQMRGDTDTILSNITASATQKAEQAIKDWGDKQHETIEKQIADWKLLHKGMEMPADVLTSYDNLGKAIDGQVQAKLEANAAANSKIIANNREALETEYEDAKRVFDLMLYSGKTYTAEQYQAQKDLVEKSKEKLIDWRDTLDNTLDHATKKNADATATITKSWIEVADAADKAKEAIDGVASSYTYDLTTQKGRQQYLSLNAGASFGGTNDQLNAYFANHSLADAIRDGLLNLPHHGIGSSSAPGGPSVVGEYGPELVNLPTGSSVMPSSLTSSLLHGSGPTSARMPIYVSGLLDKRTQHDLTELLSNEISRRFGIAVTR